MCDKTADADYNHVYNFKAVIRKNCENCKQNSSTVEYNEEYKMDLCFLCEMNSDSNSLSIIKIPSLPREIEE